MREKKSPEELKREREKKIAETIGALKLQIVQLNKKKDIAFAKVYDARQKGLKEQEEQARGLLKQTMAASKRAEGMLMTLELAKESRDLAELNMNFLTSIGDLSEDILAAGKKTSAAKTKKIGNKYAKAVFEAGKQKERIDDMLSVGDYASAASMGSDSYSEFDDEIDSMLDNAMTGTSFNTNITKEKM